MALAMLPTQAKASSEGLPLRGAIYGSEQHQILGYYPEEKLYEAPSLGTQLSEPTKRKVTLKHQ